MRRSLSLGGLAALAAALGIAAIPGASASAQETTPQWLCQPDAAECATLIVHVEALGACIKHVCVHPHEVQTPLRVAQLGSIAHCYKKGVARVCLRKVLSSTVTNEQTLHLAPGRYDVSASRTSRKTEVTVRAGQTREVTVKLHSR